MISGRLSSPVVGPFPKTSRKSAVMVITSSRLRTLFGVETCRSQCTARLAECLAWTCADITAPGRPRRKKSQGPRGRRAVAVVSLRALNARQIFARIFACDGAFGELGFQAASLAAGLRRKGPPGTKGAESQNPLGLAVAGGSPTPKANGPLG